VPPPDTSRGSDLILDNYTTHKTEKVRRWFLRHPRFHVHFTPTYSSWLNLVERFFALLSERCIKRGVHRSTWELEQDIRDYLAAYKVDPKPFVWTKTTAQILDSIRRFCDRVLDVHARKNRAQTSETGH
jgi:transposase